MSIHDHRDEYGEPINVSRHNSATYVEPDYLAHSAQAQLPTLSTIGRGPVGKGVVPQIVTSEQDGTFRFALIDDETGEQVMVSDNLSAGKLEVHAPDHEPVSGEAVTIDVCVVRGAEVEHQPITIPAGAVGSRWFCYPGHPEYSAQSLYQFPVDELVYDGTNMYRDKPIPRPNDLVVFVTNDARIVFGNVEACENGQAVVVARTQMPSPLPTISETGKWIIGGMEIEGVSAQGPKGDKGETGDRGPQGERGPQGAQGEKGLKGDKGDPAKVAVGNVATLPPSRPASVSSSYDAVTNTTTLNFGIPEGIAGKAIDIQGGIWTTDTLPEYDDTEVNTGFIVYDGDKQFDLYIRGKDPVTASDGGPWTVVEDWQGRPGSGTHMLMDPYYMSDEIDGELRIPAAEGNVAFSPSTYLTDDDIVIDTQLRIGVLSSTEDDSGDYVVTTKGKLTMTWDNVQDKPLIASGNIYAFPGLDLSSLTTLRISSVILNAKPGSILELRECFYFNSPGELSEDIVWSSDPIGEDGELLMSEVMTWTDSRKKNVYGWVLRLIGPNNEQIATLDTVACNEWDFVRHKPFSNVDTTGALRIEDDTLYSDPVTWENVEGKPSFVCAHDLFVGTTSLSFQLEMFNVEDFTGNDITFTVKSAPEPGVLGADLTDEFYYGGNLNFGESTQANIVYLNTSNPDVTSDHAGFAVAFHVSPTKSVDISTWDDQVDWNNVRNKPFSSVDTTGCLDINDGVLSSTVEYSDVKKLPPIMYKADDGTNMLYQKTAADNTLGPISSINLNGLVVGSSGIYANSGNKFLIGSSINPAQVVHARTIHAGTICYEELDPPIESGTDLPAIYGINIETVETWANPDTVDLKFKLWSIDGNWDNVRYDFNIGDEHGQWFLIYSQETMDPDSGNVVSFSESIQGHTIDEVYQAVVNMYANGVAYKATWYNPNYKSADSGSSDNSIKAIAITEVRWDDGYLVASITSPNYPGDFTASVFMKGDDRLRTNIDMLFDSETWDFHLSTNMIPDGMVPTAVVLSHPDSGFMTSWPVPVNPDLA